MLKSRFAFAVLLCSAGAAPLNAQLIGAPASAVNCIPFGCVFTTRYQQVYDASNFLAATSINQINFFRWAGNPADARLNSGTFSFFLSTTSRPVGALSNTFDDNLGADAAFFTQWVSTGGIAPAILSFDGSPFVYDPSQGNLLLDIRTTGQVESTNPTYFDATFWCDDPSICRPGSPLMSRRGEFHDENVEGGLVTQFNGGPVDPTVVPEPASMLLLGTGLAGLAGVRLIRRRRKA